MKKYNLIISLFLTIFILALSVMVAPISYASSEANEIALNQEFNPVADGCWDTYSEKGWKHSTSTLYTTQTNTGNPARSAYLKFSLADIRANLAKGAILSKAEVRLTLKSMNNNYNYYNTNSAAEGPRISLYGYADDNWDESASSSADRLTQDVALANIASKNPQDPSKNFVTVPNQSTNVTFILDVKDWLEKELSTQSDEYMSFEVGYRQSWAKDGTYIMHSKEAGNEAYRPALILTYRDPNVKELVSSVNFINYQTMKAEADISIYDGEYRNGNTLTTRPAKNRAGLNRASYIKFPILDVRNNLANGAEIKRAFVRLYVSSNSYSTATSKVSLYSYDNDNWSETDYSSVVIRSSGEFPTISKDPRNMENSHVELKKGLTVGTPVQFDVTDALIAETKKLGDNYLSAEIAYCSGYQNANTAFYTINYSGGYHPILEVEYADISITDSCIFKDQRPQAVPQVGDNTIEYTVSNSYLSDKEVVVICAIYKNNGLSSELAEVSVDKISAPALEDTVYTKNIKLSALESGESYTAKVMLWRSEESAYPLEEETNLEEDSLWMPSIFADNSVMQRDVNLPVWGKASPGAQVKVCLDGKEYSTNADRYGNWKVSCQPITLSASAYTLTAQCGAEKLEFKGILAGDVWLCAGQSNMAWILRRLETEDATQAANAADSYSQIRFFDQSKKGSDNPADDVTNGRWSICTTNTAKEFSAVGYLFGRELYDELEIPIGLINCSYGGAPMEAFIDVEALDSSDLWFRQLLGGSDEPDKNASHLWNGMLSPIIPYAIKGAIWYQGCANVNRYQEYTALSHIMINSWREKWGYEFPFIYTQIAPYTGNDAELREAQRQFLHESENTAMAVIMDLGEKNNIHPVNKLPVAERLALCAKYLAYGMENVQYKFPEPVSFSLGEEGSITITYDGVYDGLSAKDGEALSGFEIKYLNSSNKTAYIEADSVVINSDNTITVKNSTIAKPTGIRYGFKAYPEPELNLYNSAGLIATPFTHSFE